MNEDSDNQGKHHDGDDAINDNAEENGMGYNKDFNGFDKNEDVTSEAFPTMGNFLCQVLASLCIFFE